MFLAAQAPLWSATEPSCGRAAAGSVGDVGDVADDVHTLVAGQRQVGLDIDAAAAPLSEASVGRDRGGLDARRPTRRSAWRSWCRPRSTRVAGADLLDARAQVDLHALLPEDLGHVGVGPVRERLEQRVAVVEQVDPCRARIEVAVDGRNRDVEHVGDRAGDLDAGRPPADDHEVERSALDELGDRGRPARTARGCASADSSRRRASTAGTSSRPRRECRRSSAASRPRAPARRPTSACPSSAVTVLRGRIDRGDLGQLDVDAVVVGEHRAQRVRDVTGRQLRGRHLIQQRLELVVVVAIDQRDVDRIMAGQLLRAAQAGEAATDDHHVPFVRVAHHASSNSTRCSPR